MAQDAPTPKRGAKATPKHIIDAAARHKIARAAADLPAGVCYMPAQISFWGNNQYGDCVTAEEAFAKNCYMGLQIDLTDAVVIAWAQQNGFLNGASLTGVMDAMAKSGFPITGYTANDGSYSYVDYTTAATMQSAIADGSGPVKIGVAADQLETVYQANNGQTGWFGVGFTSDQNEDHCVSVSGYGTLSWLASLYNISVPDGIDGSSQGYAVFTWDSIGFLDVPSLVAITGEAWTRQPTTVLVPSASSGPASSSTKQVQSRYALV